MNYFYIYNLSQARFFLRQGLRPIDIGIGNKKEVFIKFLRDEESEKVFTQWIKRKDKTDMREGRYEKNQQYYHNR